VNFFFSANGDGFAYSLKYTNAWSANPFWFGMATALYWIGIVVPVIAFTFVIYLIGFFIFAIGDWMQVRSRKKSTGMRMGGMMWFQIKIMIIAILLTMTIISVFFIVLRFILG